MVNLLGSVAGRGASSSPQFEVEKEDDGFAVRCRSNLSLTKVIIGPNSLNLKVALT